MSYRVIGLLALLVGAVALGCAGSTAKPRARRGTRIERLLKVEVAEPVRKRIQRRLEVAATVEALHKVDVAARVPGIVKKLDESMDVGRQVKAGEVMLVLAVPDLDADEA